MQKETDIVEIKFIDNSIFLKFNIFKFKTIKKNNLKNNVQTIVFSKCKQALNISINKFNKNKLDVILDLLDVGILDLNLFFIKDLIDKLQNELPDTLNKMYVINYNNAIKYFYTLISPFIDPETKEKISFN